MAEGEMDVGKGKTPGERDTRQVTLTCALGCDVDETTAVYHLPCLHCICSERCLKKLKGRCHNLDELRCTICNMTARPESLIMRMSHVEIFKKPIQVQDTELVCENCIRDFPPVAYCPDCEFLLCLPCTEVHPYLVASRTHKIVEIEDFEFHQAKRHSELIQEARKCKAHGVTGTDYCHTCSVRVCDACLADHAPHEISNVEEDKAKLRNMANLAGNLQDFMNRAEAELEAKRKQLLNEDWSRVQTAIKDHFHELLETLEKAQVVVREDVEKRFRQKVTALRIRQKCIQVTDETAQRFLEMADCVLSECEDISVCRFQRQFEDSINWIEEMHKLTTEEYESLVGRDQGLQVIAAKCAHAQNFLKDFGWVEYVQMGDSRTSGDAAESEDGGVNDQRSQDETANVTDAVTGQLLAQREDPGPALVSPNESQKSEEDNPEVERVVLDPGKESAEVERVVLDPGKESAEVERVVLDPGKESAEVGRVVLDPGKESAEVPGNNSKLALTCGKVQEGTVSEDSSSTSSEDSSSSSTESSHFGTSPRLIRRKPIRIDPNSGYITKAMMIAYEIRNECLFDIRRDEDEDYGPSGGDRFGAESSHCSPQEQQVDDDFVDSAAPEEALDKDPERGTQQATLGKLTS